MPDSEPDTCLQAIIEPLKSREKSNPLIIRKLLVTSNTIAVKKIKIGFEHAYTPRRNGQTSALILGSTPYKKNKLR